MNPKIEHHPTDAEFNEALARKWPGRDAEHLRPDGTRKRRGKSSQYEASIWERMYPTEVPA